MPKISDLPLAGPITGAETLPVVQDGTTKRAPLAAFLADTVAAATAAAGEARDEAQAAAQEAGEKLADVNAAGDTQVAAVNAAGSSQVGAVNAAGDAQVGAVNAAGAAQIAAVNAAGDEVAEVVALLQSGQKVIPAHSAQFPPHNRYFAGRAGAISYPTTNLPSSSLLAHNQAGAFFIMLMIPFERSTENRAQRIIGNLVGTSPQAFSLQWFGGDHVTGSLRECFQWSSRGASGTDQVVLTLNTASRGWLPQLIVVNTDGAGNFTMSSYSPGLAALSSTPVVSANHILSGVQGGGLLVGDVGSGFSSAVLNEPNGAFGGPIAFHGFVLGTAGTPAQWQAICEGADIVATLSGATGYRLLRDYRGGGLLANRLAAFAPGDTTLAGTINGTVLPGGHIMRQSAAQYLTFDRLPDGYVISPPDNSDVGQVSLSGRSAGLTGPVLCRVISAETGEVIVPAFRLCDSAAQMFPILRVPRFPGWGHLEFFTEANPLALFRMDSRVGCGDKAALTGQSQIEIAFNAGAYPSRPSGFTSVAFRAGTRSSPAIRRPYLTIIEPEMGSRFNGAIACAARIAEVRGSFGTACIVERAASGTSARDWIDDVALTERAWSDDVEVAGMVGKDITHVWGWYTNDSTNYPSVFDAVLRGAGPDKATHHLGDGDIQAKGFRLGLVLPTRATNTAAGPSDSDNFGPSRTGAQAGQLAFAQLWPSLIAVGPAATDLAIDNGGAGTTSGPNTNLGGPHQSTVLWEGCSRLGYRAGEAYLRAKGISPSPHNSFVNPAGSSINGARNVITIKAVLLNPFGRLITDNNMVRVDAVASAGHTVTVDGNVITYVASGATGLQVNVAASASAQAAALAACINANLSATHRAHAWNRMVIIDRLDGQRQPVISLSGAGSVLPGAVPQGFEISQDGGVTASRSGFTAAIADNETITLTKTSGAWPANVRWRYLAGGPFSYGTAVELDALYKGGLYDGCDAENGLGFPLLGVPDWVAIP